MEEQIICFQKEILKGYLNKSLVFFDAHLWHCILENLQAIPRSSAETNYRLKQLVAYVIVVSGKAYLTYKRTKKTGEKRLSEKYSLGIGGHVNVGDRSRLLLFDDAGKIDFIKQAALREIDEEIKIDSDILVGPEIECFINDDSNDVGKVHFGTVWSLRLSEPKVSTKTELGISRLKFQKLHYLDVRKSSFEKWSQLLIEYFMQKEV